MVRGAASRCLRVPGGLPVAAIALIGSLWLVSSSAAAQPGSPYLPDGYGAPTSAAYVAPAPPPVSYTPRTTSIRGLWIPGLIGLPVAWVATWVNASLSLTAGSEGVNVAFIPVAGPWLVLAAQNVDVAYYVITGIVQDLSLLCLVLGLAIRVPEPTAHIALGPSLPELRVTAIPTASGGALSASVQF